MKFKLRQYLKKILPDSIRRLILGGFSYCKRLLIWPIILWQVRGVDWIDKWSLCKSAIASPFLSFNDLMVWQDPILLADTNVCIRHVGRFHLRKKSDDLYHVLPWREKAVFDNICKLLKEGDIFIDAGANIGFFTILASRLVGYSGSVISIEMIPDTADQLEKHVRLNNHSNVKVFRNALSDISGVDLIAMVEPGRFGRSSISIVHKEAFEVSVITTTLDEVSNDQEYVKLLKMDIEGSEYQALLGGKSMVKRLENVIYEKWNSDKIPRDTVAEFLIREKFTISRIDGSNFLASRN